MTPWTVACQTSLSMGFSRQEYWSELPFPTPGDLPDPGIKPTSPETPALTLKYWGIYCSQIELLKVPATSQLNDHIQKTLSLQTSMSLERNACFEGLPWDLSKKMWKEQKTQCLPFCRVSKDNWILCYRHLHITLRFIYLKVTYLQLWFLPGINCVFIKFVFQCPVPCWAHERDSWIFWNSCKGPITQKCIILITLYHLNSKPEDWNSVKSNTY